MFVCVTNSADMRHVVNVRDGSHNTAAWLLPHKGWNCKYSVRNLRREGEMRDQIPDVDASPAGLAKKEKHSSPHSSPTWYHVEVMVLNESL